MQHYIHSGEIVNKEKGICINNRAFRYGDALFESMYFTYSRIQFIDKHLARLHNGMKQLSIAPHPMLKKDNLLKQTKELLIANNIKEAARLRLQVYRKDGGFYLPEDMNCDYILEVFPLNNTEYTLNTKGLHIGIAQSVKKNYNQFSQLKTTEKLEMVLCAIEAQNNGWDDAILLNDNGFLVESSNSNIFILKLGKIFTPPLKDGPLNGIMRQNIMSVCSTLNIDCIEKSLKPEDLKNADEIFLSNAVKGIQWISAYNSKRYIHKISDKLLLEINRLVG
jgi:branched-chain amino acid aminotransferase